MWYIERSKGPIKLQERYTVEVRNKFNIQQIHEEIMSERYERLVEAINVTAVGFERQALKFKMTLNSQDPRIINARDAITTTHKALGKKKKCQSNNTLYNKKRIEMFQMYKVINDEDLRIRIGKEICCN